jgi:hypothetical protein
MSDKPITFKCSFKNCTHYAFRVVSMCAKAEDAGHFCKKERMPIFNMNKCPLEPEQATGGNTNVSN